ncbi:MAG TPA: rod shape-determining protein MreC [Mycobacteriales bacterium]|nr:rod shape-determining protein MreC [Mycobacteriales bacterium]
MYRDSRRLRLVLALLIVTSFTLITIDYRGGEGASLRGLRRGAAAVVGPVQRAVSRVVRPVGRALSSVGDLGSLGDQVDDLKKENAELRTKLRAAEDLRRRSDELDALLGASAGRGATILPATVIADSPNNFEWTVTLDRGSRDGVAPDMTVITGDGLVGRVLEVAPFTCSVLLIIDRQSAVGSRLANGQRGLLSGNGLDPLVLELREPDAPVAKGDVLLTSDSSSYVGGIPIGVAETITRQPTLTKRVTIKPYVRYTALDIVGIILSAPRDAPAPAVSPSPRPTPTTSPATSAAATAGSTPAAAPSRTASTGPRTTPGPAPSRTPTRTPTPATTPTPSRSAEPTASPTPSATP